MADQTVDWTGKSGKTYRYWFTASITAEHLMAVEGNYMFVKQLPNGNWLPVYIGQCDDFKCRLPGHERIAEAERLGATHVMTHTTPAGEAARLAEERDLIAFWNPPLNTQHRQTL